LKQAKWVCGVRERQNTRHSPQPRRRSY